MGRQRMPLRLSDQSLDEGLCSWPIADPKKHGHRVDQAIAQVDWMSSLPASSSVCCATFTPAQHTLKPERASERERRGTAATPVQSSDAVTRNQFAMPRHRGCTTASKCIRARHWLPMQCRKCEHPIRHVVAAGSGINLATASPAERGECTRKSPLLVREKCRAASKRISRRDI